MKESVAVVSFQYLVPKWVKFIVV